MVGAQDGGVSGQVVEVVHDDGHEQVDHDEAAEEDEGDKVEVGGVAATGLVWVEKFPRCLIPAVALLVAGPTSLAGQHYVRPGLSSGTSYKYKLKTCHFGRFLNAGCSSSNCFVTHSSSKLVSQLG